MPGLRTTRVVGRLGSVDDFIVMSTGVDAALCRTLGTDLIYFRAERMRDLRSKYSRSRFVFPFMLVAA